jgi:hypothetical protein
MSHILPDSNIITTANTKVAQDCKFIASIGMLKVNDTGFIRLVAAVNLTTNDVIYNIGDPSLSGLITGNEVVVDFTTTSMGDRDLLYVLYESSISDNIETLLQKQIDNQKLILKQLIKINQ